jgi:hypothetical protein
MLPTLQYYGFKIVSYQVLKDIKSSGRHVVSKNKELKCFLIYNHENQRTLSASENATFVIKKYSPVNTGFLNCKKEAYLITKVISASQVEPESITNNKNQLEDRNQPRYEKIYQKPDNIFWKIEPVVERDIFLAKFSFHKKNTRRE